MSAIIGSLIRKGLVFVGGWVVSHGWMTADESSQTIQVVVGAVMAALRVAWRLTASSKPVRTVEQAVAGAGAGVRP